MLEAVALSDQEIPGSAKSAVATSCTECKRRCCETIEGNHRCRIELHSKSAAVYSEYQVEMRRKLDECLKQFKKYLENIGIPEDKIFMIGNALEEAIINAIYHGNLKLSSRLRDANEGTDDDIELRTFTASLDPMLFGRPVVIEVNVSKQDNAWELAWTITDPGEGFDHNYYLTREKTLAELEIPGGNGIILMRGVSDQVIYNELGNSVKLVSRVEMPA